MDQYILQTMSRHLYEADVAHTILLSSICLVYTGTLISECMKRSITMGSPFYEDVESPSLGGPEDGGSAFERLQLRLRPLNIPNSAFRVKERRRVKQRALSLPSMVPIHVLDCSP